MKGIILKDLYENFYIKKNLASYIFGSAIFILTMVMINSRYNFILFSFMLPLVFGSCTLEASYEQDEKANFNRLQITFPLTKAEIVFSKYLLALIFTGISALASLVYALVNVYALHIVTLPQALIVWGLGISVTLIFTAVVYIFYFLLGKKSGTIIYVACAALLGALYGGSTVFFGTGRYLQEDTALLLYILLPASALIFALSCLLSIQIYKRRYS